MGADADHTLAFAHAYVRQGWAVLALEPRAKVPDGKLCPKGVRDATLDLGRVRDWWDRKGAPRGIGIAAGPSGLVIVDVDPRNGGVETMRALTERHGSLPMTPVACTGGGGWHVFFRAPDPAVVLRNAANVLGPGVDLKSAGSPGSAGGYVVAPPSWHPNGVAYAWHPEHRPSATPLADLPGWMIDVARVVEPDAAPPPRSPSRAAGGPSAVARASAYLSAMDPSISGSGGHMALWKAAKALVIGFALEPEEALDLLRAEFNPRCKPPWPLNALRHKIDDAARDTKSVRGWLLAAPRQA